MVTNPFVRLFFYGIGSSAGILAIINILIAKKVVSEV